VWTQLAGPGQAVITNGNTSIATVSGLVAGTYAFQLKVADDFGASSTDTINVVVVDSRTGQKTSLSIYPNPSSGLVNLTYVSSVNGNFRVSVYNSNKQLMKQQMIDKTQTSLTETIDITNYRVGTYFIEVVSPDKKKTTKQVVKM